MVALKGTKIENVAIEEVVGKQKLMDPHCELIEAGRQLGIEFGG